MNQPNTKDEMLELIKNESIKKNYNFETLPGYLFKIVSNSLEIRGSIHETGKEDVKVKDKCWIGIWNPIWEFFDELGDRSKCFIIEIDHLQNNHVVIPVDRIPESALQPVGSGRGLSFILKRKNGSYQINRNESFSLTEYTNNLEKMYEALLQESVSATDSLCNEIVKLADPQKYLDSLNRDTITRWTEALKPLNAKSSDASYYEWISKLDLNTLTEIYEFIIHKEQTIENEIDISAIPRVDNLSGAAVVVMCGLRFLQRQVLGKANMNAHKYTVLKYQLQKALEEQSNYWVFVVTDHPKENLTTQQIYETRMKDKFWGLNERTPFRNVLRKGDRVIFSYGAKQFLGIAALASSSFELSNEQKTTLSHDNEYFKPDYGVTLTDIITWQTPKPIESIIDMLSFIKNKDQYHAYFQGGIKRISKEDYEIITGDSLVPKEEMKEESNWIKDLTQAFIELGGPGNFYRLSQIYETIVKIREQRSEGLPKNYEAMIRFYLETNSRGTGRDLFALKEKGSGYWMLKSSPSTQERGIWKVTPGKTAQYWNEFLSAGVIAIGWNELPDLSNVENKEELKKLFRETYPNRSDDEVNHQTAEIWNFVKEIKEDDIIVANKGITKIVGIGKVIGNYYHEPDFVYHHTIPVDWYDTKEKDIPPQAWQRTVMKLEEDKIKELGIITEVTVEEIYLRKPQNLAIRIQNVMEKLAVSRETLEDIVTNLLAGNHVILIGAPGTGKTELAKLLPKLFFDNSDSLDSETNYCDIVTANADWTTYDVIGGLKKVGNDLKTYKGCVVKAVEKCSRTKSHWLIIDEFNRADIDKAFGAMFTAMNHGFINHPWLNPDKEMEEGDVLVPANFRIITTMNTFDKNYLYTMSYGLSRRFAHIDVPVPPRDQEKKILDREVKGFTREEVENILRSKFFVNAKEELLKVVYEIRSECGLQVGTAQVISTLTSIATYLLLGNENQTVDRAFLSNVVAIFEGQPDDMLEKIIGAVPWRESKKKTKELKETSLKV